MSFISIPCKKTYEVDLANPVQRWIASTYSSADKPESTQAANDFQKLRNNAVCRLLDRHESSLEVLYRYYDQLVAVESKLPFNASQIILPFKWKDAFDRGSLFSKTSITLTNGGYERACVLFNIAALQGQVAAAQALDNDNELKLCAKLFQQSAGTFNTLKDCVMGLVGQEATPDLMPDTLSALSALMVAQGQEALYTKTSRDKMKPAIVAKIAAQAADLYSDAHKQMSRELLRGLWERDWLATINSKQVGFQALAHYYQAMVAKEEKDVGVELAHLTRAQELMSANAAQLFGEDAGRLQRAFAAAKKDNDFIYHERIPDVKSLPPIAKAALSKPLPMSTPMSAQFKDLFHHLVPVVVQQALAAFEMHKSAIVNTETARVREATQLANGILSSLNLPAAVEDATNAEVMPHSIKDKAAAVRSAGGFSHIRTLIDELPSLLTRNKEILDETARLLTEEKSSDDQLRAQFKEKWTRLPSERLSEPLWQEIGKYKQILETATGADEIVRSKFSANRRGIELLGKSEGELRATIPGIAGGGGGATPAVQRLKQLLAQLEEVKAGRQMLEDGLKIGDDKFDMTTTFLRALAESGALSEGIATDRLNDVYAPLRENISKSIQEQELLLQQIQEANIEFSKEKGSGGNEREAFLRELAAAADAYQELAANLQEGTKFYNDLTPLLVRLQQKISDFCFARKTEKEELLKDVQQGIVSAPNPETPNPPQHHGGTDQRVPPGRPPPPTRPPTAAAAPTAPAPQQQQQQQQPYLQYNPGVAPAYQPQPQYAAYGQQPPNVPYGQQQMAYPYPTTGGAGYAPMQQAQALPYPTTAYPYQMPMPAQPMQQGYSYGYQQQPQAPYPQQPQWR